MALLFRSYRISGRIEFGIFSTNEPKTLPVLSIRPTVAEHVLSVFGRSVHPELFLSYKTRTIQRSNYRARIDITSDGHLVSFTGTRGATLSEVVGSLQQSLPQQRKLLSTLMRGRYVEEVQGKRGLQYRSEFELEQVSAEMFWMLHNQFTTCCSQDELMHAFDSSGRFPFGAISFVHIETRERQMLIQAFHTFPDDYSIVKSTSVFSIAPPSV